MKKISIHAHAGGSVEFDATDPEHVQVNLHTPIPARIISENGTITEAGLPGAGTIWLGVPLTDIHPDLPSAPVTAINIIGSKSLTVTTKEPAPTPK